MIGRKCDMNSMTVPKRILLVLAAVITAVVGTLAWGFFSGLRTFRIEDRIRGTYFPVSIAIECFADTNGVPPESLANLISTFLPSIPTSPLVDKLEYRVVDGTNWIMNAHSAALTPSRTYSWRSDWHFTDQERSELMKEFHNVAVFRE